jgi:uncharacterized protein YbjT (DUF2867 family)
MKVVVTTPTGAIGHKVVSRMLEAGVETVVIARDPEKLDAGVRSKVHVVQGSHDRAEVLERALSDADAMLWVVPPSPSMQRPLTYYSEFSQAAMTLLRGSTTRVVGISALGRGYEGDAGMAGAALRMDDLFISAGVNYQPLILPSFFDNFLMQAGSIAKHGTFSSVLPPDQRAPMCATADIATVAARLILDGWAQNVTSVPVLGPEDLSFNDVAAAMTQVLGYQVEYRRITEEDFVERLVRRGTSEPLARGLLAMAVAKGRGLDNGEPRTLEATTPTTIRQWCQEELVPAVTPIRESLYGVK